MFDKNVYWADNDFNKERFCDNCHPCRARSGAVEPLRGCTTFGDVHYFPAGWSRTAQSKYYAYK